MNTNKRIIHVLIVISALFLALLSYLLYFNMFQAEKVSTNPYNRRQWDDERYVTRGTIYDSNGLVLAETIEDEDGVSKRVYSQGRLYSHVIGYCSKVYGKSLLEMKYDAELLGKGDLDLFQGDKKKGFDLNLTIDNTLQKYAYEQMRGKRGALVALDPQTGKVLTMISLPDFEPDSESLETNWGDIVENEDSPLIARTIQGLYPPGSTYKIVTAAAAYENGMANRTFKDEGKFTVGNLTVENYGGKSYGEITLERAFQVSSNQVFCTIGFELGNEIIKEIADRFWIGKKVDFDLETAISKIEYKKMSDSDAALVAIGQGQLLVTPMQMALVCSSVANGGKIMRPYLVESITKKDTIIQTGKTKVLGQAISETCAAYITEQMIETVKQGTGKRAQINGIEVAGKTGTAENEKEKDHAWFVGFAPAESPEIAIAVILENDGRSGGDSAAPIARNVIKKYLSIIN